MKYVVCYDIREDNTRTKVSDACKETGLERIQYSVFVGELKTHEKRTLYEEVKKIIKDNNANIHFIPISQTHENSHLVVVSINPETEEPQLKEDKFLDISTELEKHAGVLIL